MKPEKKYELFNSIKLKYNVISNKFYKRDSFFQDPTESEKFSTIAIWDVLEYYKIDIETFWKYVDNWPTCERELWLRSENPVEFYLKWNDRYSMLNVCANTINQLAWTKYQTIVPYYFSNNGIYADFGCGTATLSLGLKINDRIKGDLILLDIPNDVQDYVKYRINKYNLNGHVKYQDAINFKENFSFDGILCIDVLEHIENSSEVFIEKIVPMIKKGGFLILRAPWRGQLTHPDSAADNFYGCGGRQFLSKHFKEVFRFGTTDIDCVYKKV